MSNYIMVVDFGGSSNQLIARRVREAGVYSEVISYKNALAKTEKVKIDGIILTGGYDVAFTDSSPRVDKKIFELGVPVLANCYGMKVMAEALGASVKDTKCCKDAVGMCDLNISGGAKLFEGIANNSSCGFGSGEVELPSGFEAVASSECCKVAAFANEDKNMYGVMFHAMDARNEFAVGIIDNFVKNICKLEATWNMESFIESKIAEIKAVAGNSKVVCGLSGGVDSSISAALVSKAIGKNLTCIFVDTGLMRKDEPKQVKEMFEGQFDMNLVMVDAEKRFLDRLAGVTDPETKRKIIGEEFIRVFEDEAAKCEDAEFLVQGTIYPDIIESGTETMGAVKSHHNVGGLPEDMKFKLIEPMRELFKDEVRAVGTALGLPDHIVWRQPFPGPGLGVRVIGELTKPKLDTLRDADAIVREEIANAGLDREIWQYFAVLTNIESVGVRGEERTYQRTVGIRAIHSTDAMAADWARIPYDVLAKMSTRIVNEVEGVNRVVYDITAKPPATIEWE